MDHSSDPQEGYSLLTLEGQRVSQKVALVFQVRFEPFYQNIRKSDSLFLFTYQYNVGRKAKNYREF